MQVVHTTELPQSPQPRPQDSPFSALARQLQVRLQYARLKVEHGWQKQNLNEVENLYFHHHHLRDTSNNSQSLEKSASSSKGQSQRLRPNISVFDSRQQPSDILLLHPPDVPERQESSMDNALDMQVDYVTTNTAPRNSEASSSPADLPAETGDDFAPEMPHFIEVGETGVQASLGTSGLVILNAAGTMSPSSTPVVGEDDILELSQVGDDEPEQVRHATLLVSPECGTSEGTLTRPPRMTYDSFWSSHSNNGTKYGYGPYTASCQAVQGSVATSMAGIMSQPPDPSLASRVTDVAMADVLDATNV